MKDSLFLIQLEVEDSANKLLNALIKKKRWILKAVKCHKGRTETYAFRLALSALIAAGNCDISALRRGDISAWKKLNIKKSLLVINW